MVRERESTTAEVAYFSQSVRGEVLVRVHETNSFSGTTTASGATTASTYGMDQHPLAQYFTGNALIDRVLFKLLYAHEPQHPQ